MTDMGSHENRRVIRLSRKKILMLSSLALGFTAVGVLVLSVLDQSPRYDTPVIRLLLMGSTGLFGMALLYFIYKIFDDSPGLVLDAEGIHDNSSAVAAGMIPWSEITDISVSEASGQRFITIGVRDPRRFLDRGHYLKRLLMKANLKMYGSPVQISANSLQIEFDQLLSLVEEYYERHATG